MRLKQSQHSLIVLGAGASGVPALARALAGHSRLHRVDDGAGCDERMAVITSADGSVAQAPGSAGEPAGASWLGRAAQALGERLPEALIVHLVRDGRAVAIKRAGARTDDVGLRRWASEWIAEITPLLAFEAANPERVVKIAYEDLLATPGAVLEKLCLAAGIEPEASTMADALRAAWAPEDQFVFRADLLDSWQLLELEGVLQPALSLLGYRPAGDLEGVARLRRDAEAYRDARAEADALRAELQEYQRVIARAAVPAGGAHDDERVEAVAREVATLHGEAQRYEAALDELRQLRFQIRDQQDETPDIRMLRWKAKRYDQIRAAASPLLRLRRLGSRR